VTHSQDTLSFQATKQGLLEITDDVAHWLTTQPITRGLLTLFLRHTSASILIQENADADVTRDLEQFFNKLAPEDSSLYQHITEGSDDMPAHIKSALSQTQLSVPVDDSEMLLGTWQGIFLFEHRRNRASGSWFCTYRGIDQTREKFRSYPSIWLKSAIWPNVARNWDNKFSRFSRCAALSQLTVT